MDNRKSENNKRLAKNTLALYCRTAIVMVVSLYVTRILLQYLGKEDYGLYNVVASVVVLFSFLNASMTQTIQRYITYELSTGDNERCRNIFSLSFIAQLIVIVFLILLCEVLGVWFINNKLNIEPDRLVAANWAFQFSILTFCVNLLRVPYESSVIAYEKMSFFAYASIIDAILKVVLVFLIKLSPIDNLIFYSILLFGETFLMFIVYQTYCKWKFPICHFKYYWNRGKFLEIISFSGWSTLGSASNIATQKGVIFLLNVYAGVIANAAMGIATQVASAINSFIMGFQTAFRPQIVKAYAQGEDSYLLDLITRTSKFSFCLVIIPAILIIVNATFILNIWLTDVPEYTVTFCRLIIICCVIDAITGSYNCAVIATGKIKFYQIAICISFLLDVFFCYLMLAQGVSPNYILISRIMTRGVLNMIIGLHFLKVQIQFDVQNYMKRVLLPIIGYLLIIVPALWYFSNQYDGWVLLLVTMLYTILLATTVAYFVLLNKNERVYLMGFIKKVIKVK